MIRCCFFKCHDVQHTISVYIKYQDVPTYKVCMRGVFRRVREEKRLWWTLGSLSVNSEQVSLQIISTNTYAVISTVQWGQRGVFRVGYKRRLTRGSLQWGQIHTDDSISSWKGKKDQSWATRTGKDLARSNRDLLDFDLWVIVSAFLTSFWISTN